MSDQWIAQSDQLLKTLREHAGAYHEMLRAHFQLHLAPFAQ